MPMPVTDEELQKIWILTVTLSKYLRQNAQSPRAAFAALLMAMGFFAKLEGKFEGGNVDASTAFAEAINCDPAKELFCKAYDAVIVDRFGGANANHQN